MLNYHSVRGSGIEETSVQVGLELGINWNDLLKQKLDWWNVRIPYIMAHPGCGGPWEWRTQTVLTIT